MIIIEYSVGSGKVAFGLFYYSRDFLKIIDINHVVANYLSS